MLNESSFSPASFNWWLDGPVFLVWTRDRNRVESDIFLYLIQEDSREIQKNLRYSKVAVCFDPDQANSTHRVSRSRLAEVRVFILIVILSTEDRPPFAR